MKKRDECAVSTWMDNTKRDVHHEAASEGHNGDAEVHTDFTTVHVAIQQGVRTADEIF